MLRRLLIIKRFVYLGAGGGGGDAGFQVRGMFAVFWGGVVKFSIPGFFWGRKIWQVFFGGSLIYCRDFLGYSNQSEDSWWCPRILAAKFANKVPPNKVQLIISFNAFKTFLRLVNSAWDFLGVTVWSRDFLGIVGSPRDLSVICP